MAKKRRAGIVPRTSVLRPASDLRFAAGLGLAVALPAMAKLVSEVGDWRLPSLPFTLAVIGAAIVGRLVAGLVAAVFSTVLVGYYVLEPGATFSLDAITFVNLVAFLVLAVGVSWLFARTDALAEQRRDAVRSLSVAVRAGALGAWTWDARTNEVMWDVELERIHGLPPGGFDGRYETYVALQHPDDRELIREEVDRAVAQARGYRVVHRIVTPAGAIRWIEGFAEPIVERDTVVGLTGVARDVTQEQTHQHELQRALRFAERLQVVAADLARAATPQEVGDAIVTNARDAVGADTAALYAVEEDGGMRLLSAAGYDEATLDAYRVFPADAEVPVTVAVRDDATLLLADRAAIEARYPAAAAAKDGAEVLERSIVACPVSAGGGVIGALFFAAFRDDVFGKDDLPLLEAIASQCGVAFDRAGLLVSERRSREELEDLLSITDVTLATFEFDQLVERLTDRLTAVLGVDEATLLLLSHDRRSLEEIRGPGPPMRVPVGGGIAGKVATTGEPLVVDDLSTYEVGRPWLREMASFLGVPVASRGRVTGVLHVTTRAPRRFSDADVRLLRLAASRLASSLERTRLYRDREQTSRVLQQSILPGRLPEIPGLDLEGLYEAYAPGEDVGGDFFDAFPLADGTFLLAIGDVSGKGASAAAVMGFVRHSLRAIARFVSDPEAIVAELNRALLDDSPTPGERFCTVVVARLEPFEDRAHLSLVRGGHEIPLVVRRDGTVEQLVEGGAPIGMWPDVDIGGGELDLLPGDALVLFTDGLVETPETERRDALVEILAELAGAPASEIVAVLRARLVEPAASKYDDVAVLVAAKR